MGILHWQMCMSLCLYVLLELYLWRVFFSFFCPILFCLFILLSDCIYLVLFLTQTRFFYHTIILITLPTPSTSPSSPQPPPLPHVHWHHFIFRKEQASKRWQLDRTKQDTIRQGEALTLQLDNSNLIEGTSPKQADESETHMLLLVHYWDKNESVLLRCGMRSIQDLGELEDEKP